MLELRYAGQSQGAERDQPPHAGGVDETVGAVLLAGDKTGSWRERYEVAVLTADALYDDHLRRQRP